MRTTLAFVLAAFALTACGSDNKHAKSAADQPINDPSSAKEDMPAAPAEHKDAADAPAAETPKETQSLAIKIAPMKLTPAKKGKTFEVKADGTITADGKKVAKIAGDQIDATDGSGTIVTVSMDGSLVGQAVKPGLKLDGDDLVSDKGAKLSVGDDGAITATKDGKSETLGKVEGAGASQAKRTAALVAGVLMAPASVTSTPAAAGPAPKASKDTAKTAK